MSHVDEKPSSNSRTAELFRILARCRWPLSSHGSFLSCGQHTHMAQKFSVVAHTGTTQNLQACLGKNISSRRTPSKKIVSRCKGSPKTWGVKLSLSQAGWLEPLHHISYHVGRRVPFCAKDGTRWGGGWWVFLRGRSKTTRLQR